MAKIIRATASLSSAQSAYTLDQARRQLHRIESSLASFKLAQASLVNKSRLVASSFNQTALRELLSFTAPIPVSLVAAKIIAVKKRPADGGGSKSTRGPVTEDDSDDGYTEQQAQSDARKRAQAEKNRLKESQALAESIGGGRAPKDLPDAPNKNKAKQQVINNASLVMGKLASFFADQDLDSEAPFTEVKNSLISMARGLTLDNLGKDDELADLRAEFLAELKAATSEGQLEKKLSSWLQKLTTQIKEIAGVTIQPASAEELPKTKVTPSDNKSKTAENKPKAETKTEPTTEAKAEAKAKQIALSEYDLKVLKNIITGLSPTSEEEATVYFDMAEGALAELESLFKGASPAVRKEVKTAILDIETNLGKGTNSAAEYKKASKKAAKDIDALMKKVGDRVILSDTGFYQPVNFVLPNAPAEADLVSQVEESKDKGKNILTTLRKDILKGIEESGIPRNTSLYKFASKYIKHAPDAISDKAKRELLLNYIDTVYSVIEHASEGRGLEGSGNESTEDAGGAQPSDEDVFDSADGDSTSGEAQDDNELVFGEEAEPAAEEPPKASGKKDQTTTPKVAKKAETFSLPEGEVNFKLAVLSSLTSSLADSYEEYLALAASILDEFSGPINVLSERVSNRLQEALDYARANIYQASPDELQQVAEEGADVIRSAIDTAVQEGYLTIPAGGKKLANMISAVDPQEVQNFADNGKDVKKAFVAPFVKSLTDSGFEKSSAVYKFLVKQSNLTQDASEEDVIKFLDAVDVAKNIIAIHSKAPISKKNTPKATLSEREQALIESAESNLSDIRKAVSGSATDKTSAGILKRIKQYLTKMSSGVPALKQIFDALTSTLDSNRDLPYKDAVSMVHAAADNAEEMLIDIQEGHVDFNPDAGTTAEEAGAPAAEELDDAFDTGEEPPTEEQPSAEGDAPAPDAEDLDAFDTAEEPPTEEQPSAEDEAAAPEPQGFDDENLEEDYVKPDTLVEDTPIDAPAPTGNEKTYSLIDTENATKERKNSLPNQDLTKVRVVLDPSTKETVRKHQTLAKDLTKLFYDLQAVSARINSALAQSVGPKTLEGINNFIAKLGLQVRTSMMESLIAVREMTAAHIPPAYKKMVEGLYHTVVKTVPVQRKPIMHTFMFMDGEELCFSTYIPLLRPEDKRGRTLPRLFIYVTLRTEAHKTYVCVSRELMPLDEDLFRAPFTTAKGMNIALDRLLSLENFHTNLAKVNPLTVMGKGDNNAEPPQRLQELLVNNFVPIAGIDSEGDELIISLSPSITEDMENAVEMQINKLEQLLKTKIHKRYRVQKSYEFVDGPIKNSVEVYSNPSDEADFKEGEDVPHYEIRISFTQAPGEEEFKLADFSFLQDRFIKLSQEAIAKMVRVANDG